MGNTMAELLMLCGETLAGSVFGCRRVESVCVWVYVCVCEGERKCAAIVNWLGKCKHCIWVGSLDAGWD